MRGLSQRRWRPRIVGGADRDAAPHSSPERRLGSCGRSKVGLLVAAPDAITVAAARNPSMTVVVPREIFGACACACGQEPRSRDVVAVSARRRFRDTAQHDKRTSAPVLSTVVGCGVVGARASPNVSTDTPRAVSVCHCLSARYPLKGQLCLSGRAVGFTIRAEGLREAVAPMPPGSTVLATSVRGLVGADFRANRYVARGWQCRVLVAGTLASWPTARLIAVASAIRS
jgi:hypothetical protein